MIFKPFDVAINLTEMTSLQTEQSMIFLSYCNSTCSEVFRLLLIIWELNKGDFDVTSTPFYEFCKCSRFWKRCKKLFLYLV